MTARDLTDDELSNLADKINEDYCLVSAYAREEIAVIVRYGAERCLERTIHGSPWAMPCILDKGHEGDHLYRD